MAIKEVDPISRLKHSVLFVVLGHFGVVIWHLLLLVKVQPNTPPVAIAALFGMNLVPVAALVLFARGFCRLAGSMVLAPLGIALVIGAYTHFASDGTDNVLRMPPGDWRLQFQISAMLLVLLDALGCWLAVKMLRTHYPAARVNA
jgi:hypothetical protein